MQQRVDAFEFNERFLLILHDHAMSCQFGTFIGNCEKDRLDLGVREKTYSLWGYMMNHLNEYVNPLYRPEMDEIILPNLAPQCIKFWRGMYSRYESGVHPREPLDDLLLATSNHTASLEDHVQHLTKVRDCRSMRIIEHLPIKIIASLYFSLKVPKILTSSH
jgi:myotubularin-related protein 6/7/8